MIHLMAGCADRQQFLYQTDPDALTLARQLFPLPKTRFLVFSDPHLYDIGLGTSGKAFQDYLDSDRKLLVLSNEILEKAVTYMAGEEAEFVLVCGDLTKDAEQVCHKGMVRHLARLRQSGKKVFVVPGNHDVNNPEAVRFLENSTEPVPMAGPDEFRRFYHEFGYKNALSRDEDSLGYVAEPVDGLWLLALDSCRWKENRPGHHAVVGGAFSPKTLAWIEGRLLAAKQAGKAIIVCQHHGIAEHYPANKKFYDEYIVRDDDRVAELLSTYGVSLVFTGHFHAQDVTRKQVRATGRPIYDIETGSLVTAPCPYRMISVEKPESGRQSVQIQSRFITSIPSMGEKFAAHARDYVFQGTQKLANASLDKYWVSKTRQPLINHQVARSYLAHLTGDEVLPKAVLDPDGFGPWLRFIAWLQEDLIKGWYTDLPPADNNLTIQLEA